ncbi:Uncharacterised protein [BD1-7 clade bacterium]|uniref:Thiolase-like protein type 1 additional C-terminal domain-containing protein n=1 Tax=BD1-7 clade bacterium TaxID=2029982 RepID=A0A5S9PGN2_9GAMM|nr:Uncharacterised protein [BD1-7 clade bacterium]CAA0110279.1 Uncharacterised protein [BD1-7 clade bacterium]
MFMIADNSPVIVAAAAVSQKITDPQALPAGADAIDLMAQACQQAAASIDCPSLLAAVDQISVPQGLWPFNNPAAAIAQQIGAPAAATLLAKIGVLQQGLISDACRAIESGEKSVCVVAGGEAKYRELIASVNSVELPVRDAQPEPDRVWEPEQELWLESESTAGLGMPVGYYALMDSAWRHKNTLAVDEHRDAVADLYAGFSHIAADNADAWKRKPLSADSIRDASDENPMLAFPYTKRHNTSWNVDQASAVIICSIAKARELGIDEAFWVYPAASTECNQILAVSQRADLGGCLGAEMAGQAALSLAGIDATQLDFIELYSCFPIAMLIYADALGLPRDKDMTVTGAMPFAGGPLNNFVIQSTAKMIEKLQATPAKGDAKGIVTTVSGMLTKQGFGVYSREPVPYRFADVTDDVIAVNPPKNVLPNYAGSATIAAATVLYQKNQPERAVIIADLADGSRCLAFSQDAAVMQAVEDGNTVGSAVDINDHIFALSAA